MKIAIDNDQLVFGSEEKVILQYPGFKVRVNFDTLHNFLGFGYNKSQETFFQGIHKVPPSHLMVYQKGKKTKEQ